MGLLKATSSSVRGVLGDQWKEFFYCDSIANDTLMVKGQKKTDGKKNTNYKGIDNIISNGSRIAVANGQAMAICDNGKIVEFSAEPGEFIWNSSSEPTVFSGKFGKSLIDSFKNIGTRITFGGNAPKDQRIYYFNLKEIVGNKYGTPQPVPFRVVDENIGLDIDVSIRCNGEYSYHIVDPLAFFTNFAGNTGDGGFKREIIDSQLKSELLTALQPAFAKISTLGIRYSALPGHTLEIAAALNDVLTEKWKEKRGLAIAEFGINSVSASKEDEDMIKELQKSAVFRNAGMAAAYMTTAQGEAMKGAAKNSGGAMMGFLGLNQAMQSGGMNANTLFQIDAQQQAQKAASAKETGWKCTCGATNGGKFCAECGKPKPADGWKCACGATNKGKFCAECGKPQPVSDTWTCACGTANTGRFCNDCGAPKK